MLTKFSFRSRNILNVVIVFLLEVLLMSTSVFAQSPLTTKTVPLVELSGDNYSRGLQHGKKLKKEIAEVFAKWKKNIQTSTGKNPDSVLKAFRAAINFEPITKKYLPSILEEIKGISEGSGLAYEDVYAFQLVDEFWIYLDKQFNTTNHHCSGIGVPATAISPAYIAQNMDLENFMHGYQVLLHLAPTANEPEQYIMTCAGLVALSGMNEKGIGLCLNSLMELQASEDGLPVAFMIRAILAKKNGADAMQFLKTVKHASGQNYIMGIADSVYNFEASANKVIRFLPKGESSIVYHTNHAIVNHDVKDWYKKYHQQVLAGETNNRNSEARFASLEMQLNKQPANVSNEEVIKTILRSKDSDRNPVCRVYKEGGGGFTFSSVVFTLGKKKSAQITYGSPDQSEYQEHFFKTTN